jgi:hypothetical protein
MPNHHPTCAGEPMSEPIIRIITHGGSSDKPIMKVRLKWPDRHNRYSLTRD